MRLSLGLNVFWNQVIKIFDTCVTWMLQEWNEHKCAGVKADKYQRQTELGRTGP